MFALYRGIIFRVACVLALLLAIFFFLNISIFSRVGRITGTPGSFPQGWDGDEIRAAKIICAGHFIFDWNPLHFPQHVQLTFHQFQTWGAERVIRPFRVDHYWKGTGPSVLEIALFDSSTNAGMFAVPQDKRLLVALKDDTTGSGAYQLVEQMDTWEVIDDHAEDAWTGPAPGQLVANIVRDDLTHYTAQASLPKTDPSEAAAILHALLSISTLEMRDDETVSLLEKCIAKPDPDSYGSIRGSALSELAKIDPARAWKAGYRVYQSGPLSDYSRRILAESLATAITPDSLSQIDPSEIQQLIDSGTEGANSVSIAFMSMKDPRAIPWLGRLLTNGDRMTQCHAMLGLYRNFAGGRAGGLAEPVQSYYQGNPPFPENVIAPYRDWVLGWIAQHPEDAIPQAK